MPFNVDIFFWLFPKIKIKTEANNFGSSILNGGVI
jgi:hypothetical protein